MPSHSILAGTTYPVTCGTSPLIATVRARTVGLAVHRGLGNLWALARPAGGPAHVVRASAGMAAGVARMPLQPLNDVMRRHDLSRGLP